MSLPYPIIAVDSSNQGVHGSYLNEDGYCKTIIFPNDYYRMGNKYITNGVEIKEDVNTKLKVASAKISAFNVFRFAAKIANLLNPFCSIDNYRSGGMVKYGENLYLLCEETSNGKVKAYNFTFETMCDLDISDKGFYIHNTISTVYLTIWNLFSYIDDGNFKKHPIKHYNLTTLFTLELLGTSDFHIDYLEIISIIDALDPDTKLRARIALETFANGNTDEALEYLSECVKDYDIFPTVRDSLVRIKNILKDFDLTDKNVTKEENDILSKKVSIGEANVRRSPRLHPYFNRTNEPVKGGQRNRHRRVWGENEDPIYKKFTAFQESNMRQGQQTASLL